LISRKNEYVEPVGQALPSNRLVTEPSAKTS